MRRVVNLYMLAQLAMELMDMLKLEQVADCNEQFRFPANHRGPVLPVAKQASVGFLAMFKKCF